MTRVDFPGGRISPPMRLMAGRRPCTGLVKLAIVLIQWPAVYPTATAKHRSKAAKCTVANAMASRLPTESAKAIVGELPAFRESRTLGVSGEKRPPRRRRAGQGEVVAGQAQRTPALTQTSAATRCLLWRVSVGTRVRRPAQVSITKPPPSFLSGPRGRAARSRELGSAPPIPLTPRGGRGKWRTP